MINRFASILSLPSVYRLFIGLIGTQGPRNKFVAEYVRPLPGDRVLDLGCGPADVLNSMPVGVGYTGLDISAGYIHAAKERFGERGRFLCGDVGLVTLEQEAGSFDLVMAKGVIHHLDDEQAARLFDLARKSLKPGGRLLTFDGCYVDGQSRIARWLLSRDRGQFVRTRPEYVRLAAKSFSRVECALRHDILRVPYTHLIMCCSNDMPASEGARTGS